MFLTASKRIAAIAAAVFMILSSNSTAAFAQTANELPSYVIEQFGTPPTVPEGAFDEELLSHIQVALVDSLEGAGWGQPQSNALRAIGASADPRLAWIISDFLRFSSGRNLNAELAAAASELLGKEMGTSDAWGNVTDHLMAWDIPAPPDYLDYKRRVFTRIVPGWEGIFVEGDIDWRHVSWGGVLIDDRPYDTTDEACNCIPAADNPEVTSAEEADWLSDDTVIFGIEINGEARAYPRRIMEVREMINDTLGGRDLGIPYCTLCGAAQAYYTDELDYDIERPILRTSGLLIRSNKVMYDITSGSVFDTFLGKAVTGPLAELGVVLEQAPVITTTWGEWKAVHPDTTVLAEHLALGRDFDFRNNRDAEGPIFPVGDVDPRLPVHEDIIGIVTASGTPIAFPRANALVALTDGQAVGFENVRLVLDAGGIKAVDANGDDLGSHQAFWFAWSQFHPETELWQG
ncbi:Protein of unknown function [Cognatiyoonia sediminum]|uniref:DUF3179 domain-containing protein n=1 Tax=Cognatiyoonia sediminum TaxID=1508389 RepID=A0A1M5M716_9RHOB|nr:DUF3179 domain-containing (seleno)protein [Cognatiyoonia sediminum]SHG72543.1 Protein of unknown function [Cognatiyoonia sediminum]